MRITIGASIFDSTPASSTVTTAALRLEFDEPLRPKIVNNELRARARLYVEAASEATCKTAVDAVLAIFAAINGQTVTFFNTTGTALLILAPGDWPRLRVDSETDYQGDNALIVFDIVAERPEPVTGGSGDEPGQRGPIEWELELGPGGLTGATATAEFGPTGSTAIANAQAWLAKLYTEPPTGMPAFMGSARLRPVHALPRAIEGAGGLLDPVGISVLFRQVYSGLTSIPALTTDVNVNVNVVDGAPIDVRSSEATGVATVALSGWFVLRTEAPTDVLTGATSIGRGAIYEKALAVYNAIEGDFRTVYSRFNLREMGDAVIDVKLSDGMVAFSRAFSTGRIREWRERTRVTNVDPITINRDYKGREIVHEGNGGPVALVEHSLYIEALEGVQPYRAPQLNNNWRRTGAERDCDVSVAYRGGTILFITTGASTFRYANPNERGPSKHDTVAGKSLTPDNIGTGVI